MKSALSCEPEQQTTNEMNQQKENQKVENITWKEFTNRHKKCTNQHEDVMYRLWNIMRQCAPVLVEAETMNYLIQKHGADGFVILSPNDTCTEEYTDTATRELIHVLKESGFRYLPFYKNVKKSQNEVMTYVPRFFVFNQDTKGSALEFDELYNFSAMICMKYGYNVEHSIRKEQVQEYSFEEENVFVNPYPSSFTARRMRKGEIIISD